MECNYDLCPAKIHIQDLYASRTKFENQVSLIDKDVSEVKQHLEVHMARSDEKHHQIIDKLTDIAESFKQHTADEMKVQTEHKDKIKEVSKTVSDFMSEHTKEKEARYKQEEEQRFRNRVTWIIVSGLGTLIFSAVGYYVKLRLDILVGG